ncbi:TetR/AcrR family transcriptional regulator [Mycolicibacterium goodii]|uniref:TetR family transcriptional regulator n=1 Tax=Mycolicibacterium goodii TaxID=134601 RepID=A0A0K0XA93_MYCGD|nr:TetR family transcriptional regulator [Mycolicibacterium goodii]
MSQQSDAETGRKLQILQAAERVFAQEGYHGTTMRKIAEVADVKLSLIVYHFDTKLKLYRAIFLRRQYVNDQRLELLRNIDTHNEQAMIQLVSAFADPVLALHRNPEDLWFARLVLREASDPSSQQRGIIHELFDPMAQEFIGAMSQINPGREPGFYRWAYLFAVGALTSSSFDVRAHDLGEPDDVADLNAKAELLKRFILAGWQGAT